MTNRQACLTLYNEARNDPRTELSRMNLRRRIASGTFDRSQGLRLFMRGNVRDAARALGGTYTETQRRIAATWLLNDLLAE